MLIPLADVPRWYAERKPKDTIAVSHGADALTWEQLERNANRRARAWSTTISRLLRQSPGWESPHRGGSHTGLSRPPAPASGAAPFL